MRDKHLLIKAQKEANKFYRSESNKLIFADGYCNFFIQKCYDESCGVQSTERRDGCLIDAIKFEDLTEITKETFVSTWEECEKLKNENPENNCQHCP